MNSEHQLFKMLIPWIFTLLAVIVVVAGIIRVTDRNDQLNPAEWKCTAFVIKEEQKECVRYEKRDYE